MSGKWTNCLKVCSRFFNFCISGYYINNVNLSITNYGTIGEDDNDGGGFKYPYINEFSPEHLFQGALMIANGPSNVSDASYVDNGTINFNRDFKGLSGGNLTFIQPGEYADQELTAKFSDENADAPLGVEVNQRSYAWSGSEDEDYVIIEYNISNSGSSTLTGIRVAQHIDWDVNLSYENDFAGYYKNDALAYMYDNESNYYVGNVLLSHTPGGAKILNIVDINNGFYDQEKWDVMASVPTSDLGVPSAGDYSQILSAGPFSIAPDEEIIVALERLIALLILLVDEGELI